MTLNDLGSSIGNFFNNLGNTVNTDVQNVGQAASNFGNQAQQTITPYEQQLNQAFQNFRMPQVQAPQIHVQTPPLVGGLVADAFRPNSPTADFLTGQSRGANDQTIYPSLPPQLGFMGEFSPIENAIGHYAGQALRTAPEVLGNVFRGAQDLNGVVGQAGFARIPGQVAQKMAPADIQSALKLGDYLNRATTSYEATSAPVMQAKNTIVNLANDYLGKEFTSKASLPDIISALTERAKLDGGYTNMGLRQRVTNALGDQQGFVKLGKGAAQELQQSGEGSQGNFAGSLEGSIPPKAPVQYPSEPVINPKQVAEQARLARFSVMQGVNERAKLLAEQANSVLKGTDNNLFRQAAENPDQAQALAQKSSNPSAFTDLLNQYHDFTNHVLEQARGAKIPLHEVQDYYSHIVDLSNPADRQKFNEYAAAKTSNFTSGFSKSRVFANLAELQNAGFKLKNPKVAQDILEYAQSINKQIGAQTFSNKINELHPGGAVPFKNEAAVPRSFQGASYQQSTVPGLEGTFIDPEIQKNLSYYNRSALADNSLAKAFDKVNSFTKELRLGGGLFHAFRESVNYVGQQLAGGQLPRLDKAALSFVSPKYWQGLNKQFIDQGTVDTASKMGIQLSNIPDIGSMGESTLRGIGKLNPVTQVKQATFDRLLNFYKLDTVAKLPPGAQTPAVGRQINALYNGINSEVGGLNKTVNQIARFIFLAPQFNAGKVINVAGALKPSLSPEATFARQALIGTVVSTAIAAEIAKKVASGSFSPDLKSFLANSIVDPNFPLPYTNPAGKPQVASLPGTNVSDITRAVKDPSNFITSRFSTGISLGNQLLSGKDYFGNPNTPGSVAQSLLPIPGFQLGKTLQGQQSPATALLNTVGFRVHNGNGQVPTTGQNATAPTAPVGTPGQLSQLGKAQVKQSISDINKSEKTILGTSGALDLPVVGRIAGLSDPEKEAKLTQLEAQKKALQDQLNKPKTDYTQVQLSGDPVLDKTIISKQIGAITTQINQVTQDYANGKISSTDASQQIADLQAQQKTLRTSIAKPKAARKVSLKGLSSKAAPKFTFKAPKSKAPSFKMPKSPTLKLSSTKSTSIAKFKPRGFSNSLTKHASTRLL